MTHHIILERTPVANGDAPNLHNRNPQSRIAFSNAVQCSVLLFYHVMLSIDILFVVRGQLQKHPKASTLY